VEHRTDSLKGYSGYNGNATEDFCWNGVQSYCHTRLANPAPATLLHNPKGIFCDLAFRSSSPVGPRLMQMWWTIEQSKDWFNYLNVSFEQLNNDISSSTNRQFEIHDQFSISLFSCEANRHSRREINVKEFRGHFIEQLSSIKTDGVLIWPYWLAAKYLQK